MSKISITRRNPATGKPESPLKEYGSYTLGDPANGKDKHKTRFAVRVGTLEEVLDRVRRGFSVRMSDGVTRPSLISPTSLTIHVAGESA